MTTRIDRWQPMYFLRTTLAFNILVAVGIQCDRVCAQAPTSASQEWTVAGKLWCVHVKQHSRAPRKGRLGNPWEEKELLKTAKHKISHEFDMIIKVLAPRVDGPHILARFEFRPSEQAGANLQRHNGILEVDCETGIADEFLSRTAPNLRCPLEAKGLRVCPADVYAVPIDWIVQMSDILKVPADQQTQKTSVGRTPMDLIKTIGPVVTLGDRKNAVRIEIVIPYTGEFLSGWKGEQTWVPGEIWWRTFRRYLYDDGEWRLDLEAERILDKQ